MTGWIKISRDIDKHWLWRDAQRLKWWLDLLLMVSWEDDKEVLLDTNLTTVGRGQAVVSLNMLMERWEVSKPTVIKFLNLLEQEQMIRREVLGGRIPMLTIVNYDKYQLNESDMQPKEPKEKPAKEPAKPKKPGKHKYAEFVLLTEAEYQKLVEAYGEEGARWMITKLDNYKAARGTTYKSDYRAILNWVVGEYIKTVQQTRPVNSDKPRISESERMRQMHIEREAEQARLEQQIADSKKNAVSYEEWKRRKQQNN